LFTLTVEVRVFVIVTKRSVAAGHLCLRGHRCRRPPEDGSSKVLRNVGISPQHSTASHPTRPGLQSSSPQRTTTVQQ